MSSSTTMVDGTIAAWNQQKSTANINTVEKCLIEMFGHLHDIKNYKITTDKFNNKDEMIKSFGELKLLDDNASKVWSKSSLATVVEMINNLSARIQNLTAGASKDDVEKYTTLASHVLVLDHRLRLRQVALEPNENKKVATTNRHEYNFIVELLASYRYQNLLNAAHALKKQVLKSHVSGMLNDTNSTLDQKLAAIKMVVNEMKEEPQDYQFKILVPAFKKLDKIFKNSTSENLATKDTFQSFSDIANDVGGAAEQYKDNINLARQAMNWLKRAIDSFIRLFKKDYAKELTKLQTKTLRFLKAKPSETTKPENPDNKMSMV